jgi:hypothetical protein
MPFDDPVHCDQPMSFVRRIPKLGVLPELLVFQCARCQHSETKEPQSLSSKPVHHRDYVADD